jgi:hypothetical protein
MQLLKEPENSLRPGEPYTFERVIPSKIFGRILIADPSFIRQPPSHPFVLTIVLTTLISGFWMTRGILHFLS